MAYKRLLKEISITKIMHRLRVLKAASKTMFDEFEWKTIKRRSMYHDYETDEAKIGADENNEDRSSQELERESPFDFDQGSSQMIQQQPISLGPVSDGVTPKLSPRRSKSQDVR